MCRPKGSDLLSFTVKTECVPRPTLRAANGRPYGYKPTNSDFRNSLWSRGPKDVQGKTRVRNALPAGASPQIPIDRSAEQNRYAHYVTATPHNGARRFSQGFDPYCTIGAKAPLKPDFPPKRCCLNTSPITRKPACAMTGRIYMVPQLSAQALSICR